MLLEKFLSIALTAIDYAKMVTIITTNTAVRMVNEGSKEIVRQYHEYKKLNNLTEIQSNTKPTGQKSAKIKSIDPPSSSSKMN